MAETDTPSVPPLPPEWEMMSGVRISGGRLFLRAAEAEDMGIEPGDVVAVILEGGESTVVVGERRVQSDQRIGIPSRVVDAHALEDERVDVWLHDTGLAA